jgi:paraquat-inducible protein B
MRPADADARRMPAIAAALLVVLLAGAAAAQEEPGSLESRARALATERLAPLLEALGRSTAAAAPDGVRFQVRFAGNVQGLAVGAPVTVRGLRVGTVREVAVTFDSASGQLDVPVIIDIVPGALVVDGQRPESAAEVVAAVATLVRRGLRAQLASTSLLSASREVALDLAPDAPAAELGDGAPPEIPSVPTRLDAVSATLDKVLAEVGKLPLDRLAGEVEATLVALRELVTAPELRQAVADLATSASELRTITDQLAGRAQPLIDSLTRTADAAGPAAVATLDAARDVLAGPELREALANLTALSGELRALPAELQARGVPLLNAATSATEQAGQTVVDARRTIAALDATFGSRSTFQADVQTLLREVTGATRSLRQLLDLLERQPDVLIRGKRGGPPP